ncbi:putative tRNA-splicing endonuclease subunit tsp-1 [Sporothrix bragantina]|uniref:tRNA-splicing endonuclease subunit tsp-1 n=1 Tax=Sporothrix bragantina TaxID=671064 RepID=A0ABP0BYB3_9PEZI
MEVLSPVQMPVNGAGSSPNQDLADIVYNNLVNQQDWTQMTIHNVNECDSNSKLPRTLLSGLPPRRLYIHPDEQIEVLRAEKALGNGQRIPQPPEREWIMPVHLVETPTASKLAAVFDSITAVPPGETNESSNEKTDEQWKAWRGPRRGKRLLLAVVQDDSSVTYYFMHDGIVKPRQN